MNRIESLRKQALHGTILSDEFHYLFYKTYAQLAHLNSWKRYAESFYAAMSGLTPSISDGELIVGKRDIPLSSEAAAEWDTIYKPIAEARVKQAGDGQDSHMTIDYELLLTKGCLGIISMIDDALADCQPAQQDFFKNCRRCLEGVIAHSDNYSKLAFDLSEKAVGDRKYELLEISRICKKVPAHPAESFHEAVQSSHFISHCLSMNPYRLCPQQFQLGHPDRYLLPYYEKDRSEGILNETQAQLLLDLLGIQINHRVPHGLSSGYMVGGRTADGRIVANDLTDMCMQVIADNRLVYPAVGFCYTDGMPDQYLDKACTLLSQGHSHPAIFNDDIIVKGLKHYGVPESDAHDYIHSTCVEITPGAASNVWVASPYTNMAQLLLDCMDREYDSLDTLIDTAMTQLDRSIEANFLEQNRLRHHRNEHSINPLLSCFVNDCLKRGTDIEQGGARYNWIMPSFVGMANLVDSLYAIDHLVFKTGRFTLCELKKIIDSDFENQEALRLYILNKIPKYGNDIDDVDHYFNTIIEHIVSECTKYTGLHGNANLIPSVFCWINHERMGVVTGATPDGRKAGFPLGDGSGPCQGREMKGPTASLLSSTKWEHYPMIGGVAVNLKFTKSTLGTHSLETLKSLILTYMKRGGFELQINVTDNEILEKARKSPDAYRDLIVRIGGYSDYFVTLSPEMQAEVIMRTSHNI